jgi:hypothetical protein
VVKCSTLNKVFDGHLDTHNVKINKGKLSLSRFGRRGLFFSLFRVRIRVRKTFQNVLKLEKLGKGVEKRN